MAEVNNSLNERVRTMQIITASFMAFYFSTAVNTKFIERRNNWAGKLVGNIVAQSLDSLLFFHVAFYGVHLPAFGRS